MTIGSSEVGRNLGGFLQARCDGAARTIAKYKLDFADNPVNTLNWGDGVFTAVAMLELCREILKGPLESDTLRVFLQDRLFRSFPVPTSQQQSRNLLEQARVAVIVEILDYIK